MKVLRVIGALTVMCAAALAYGYYSITQPVSLASGDPETIIYIPRGATVESAIDTLARHGIIDAPGAMRIAAKVYARVSDKLIQRGAFSISSGIPQFEAMQILFERGKAQTVNVTFPEGIGLQTFAAIASRHIGCDSAEFMKFAYAHDLKQKYDLRTQSLEGYLMPDTYNFYIRESANEVFMRLLRQQDKVWNERFAAAAKKVGMTRHKALTLAAIIEAETPVPGEMKRVSGVYHNRLRIGMKLQADPTVQYSLGDKRRLLLSDLKVDSPYNTYLYPGLPPGPINSPGADAIEAAVNPESHNFFYFVAVGDGSGRHTFTKNAAQHQRAVARYRANRARRRG